MRKAYFEDVFYGKPFRDYEISAVYIYDRPVDEENLILQESEVEAVKWMDFKECCQEVKEGSMKNCIYMDELEIVGKYLDIWNTEEDEGYDPKRGNGGKICR